MTTTASIPRVDLEETRTGDPLRVREFDEALRASFVDFGFVRVAGHGIDADVISAVYRDFEAFFAQPEAEKRKAAAGLGGQRGFTPFGVEHARDQRTPDRKEFFHVGRELPSGHPLRAVYPENVWPEGNGALKRHALAVYDALDRCAMELLASLERSFELEPGGLADMLRDGNSILRALHYPPIERPIEPAIEPPIEAEAEPVLRAAAHEDINLITLLCEATDSGLEILTRSGAWLAVPALPGEIVADAGDMLARATNGVIPATTHRVAAAGENASRHRYSLPFFAHPRPDVDLSVLAPFVPEGEAPRFAPITAGAYLEERLREIGLLD